jgi:hypothetical protein
MPHGGFSPYVTADHTEDCQWRSVNEVGNVVPKAHNYHERQFSPLRENWELFIKSGVPLGKCLPLVYRIHTYGCSKFTKGKLWRQSALSLFNGQCHNGYTIGGCCVGNMFCVYGDHLNS